MPLISELGPRTKAGWGCFSRFLFFWGWGLCIYINAHIAHRLSNIDPNSEQGKRKKQKHAHQRSESARTYTQPTQVTLLVHRLQPTPPL